MDGRDPDSKAALAPVGPAWGLSDKGCCVHCPMALQAPMQIVCAVHVPAHLLQGNVLLHALRSQWQIPCVPGTCSTVLMTVLRGGGTGCLET